MKRSGFQPRAKPMTRCAISPGTAKLIIKKRTCKNRACRNKFTPTEKHPFAIACCTGCEIILAKQHLAKVQEARAKKERKELKARKEAAKPLKERLKATEKAVNAYILIRDAHEGCCSCDKPSHWDGKWNASHFKSVGSNSLLRFHLWNIRKGCSECNMHRAGNIGEYTKRLELRFGAERVEWLDNRKNGTRKYTAEYLDRMKKIFTKKARRAKSRLQANEGVAA